MAGWANAGEPACYSSVQISISLLLARGPETGGVRNIRVYSGNDRSGNRVISARAHWPAPAKPSRREQRASDRAVPNNGLVGVVGAGRRVPTVSTEIGGHRRLVQPYGRKREPSHQMALNEGKHVELLPALETPERPRRSFTELWMLEKSAEEASFRAISTRSQPL